MRPGASWLATIAIAGVGIALYAAAGFYSFVAQIPGTEGVYLRPGFAVLPFFGMAFGPIAGFATGFFGNALADELTGYGAGVAPLWHLANGMVGLLAWFGTYRLRNSQLWVHSRLELAAAIGVLATVIAFLTILAEVVTHGLPLQEILASEYIPAVVWNGLAATLGLPVLMHLWDCRSSIAAAIGRGSRFAPRAG